MMIPTISDLEATLIAIVLTLRSRNVEAYGVTINDELTAIRGGKEITAGALYTNLQRLVDKGLLEATMTAPLPERGGRGKRLYEVTGVGKKAYEAWESQARRALQRFAETQTA
jgi:DNA-binding PadR family transcriptional regulator